MEGDWQKELPDYLGCCHALDTSVGRIRKKLEQMGIADETLIIYVSDHGSHFRTRNDEYKRSCHDGSIRIPLIIYGPGFKGGKVIDDLVSLIDLAPTVMQAAGAELKPHFQGRPLQDLIYSRPKDWRKEIYIQISESHVGRAIRTERWKYSVIAPDRDGWNEPAGDVYIEDCLYDFC